MSSPHKLQKDYYTYFVQVCSRGLHQAAMWFDGLLRELNHCCLYGTPECFQQLEEEALEHIKGKHLTP